MKKRQYMPPVIYIEMIDEEGLMQTSQTTPNTDNAAGDNYEGHGKDLGGQGEGDVVPDEAKYGNMNLWDDDF